MSKSFHSLKVGVFSDPDSFFNCDEQRRKRFVEQDDIDVWIVNGKITSHGNLPQMISFLKFLKSLKSKYKILIGGNTDGHLDGFNPLGNTCITNFTTTSGCYYLKDSGVIIEGVSFWGTPYYHFNNVEFAYYKAFCSPNSQALSSHWEMIPNDTDVLLTFAPPYGVLDEVKPAFKDYTFNSGNEELYYKVMDIHPKVHCFSFAGNNGKIVKSGITFINSSLKGRDNNVIHDFQTFEINI